MQLPIFKLEEYLSKYEFNAPYLLCCSDAQSMSMKELLSLAEEEEKNQWNDLSLGYTEVRGLPALRKQIVHTLYPALNEGHIHTFCGAQEAIFCGLSALLSSNDHAIVLTPCYQSLKEIPRYKGAEVSEVELKEENQWRINLNDIKNALRPNTRCIIINFPHNPTGQVLRSFEMADLVALCRANKLWLFSDEVYRLLGIPKEGWPLPIACVYERGISLGVMSKAYGMGGLRLGWIACQDKDFLQKIEYMRHYISISNTAPSELLSLIALKNHKSILTLTNEIVKENLSLLDHFFEKHSSLFRWVRPQGGCTGFVRYLGDEKVEDFCKRLVKEKGVLLLPSSQYGLQSQHFRIGFGRLNMKEALEVFESFLKRKSP